MSLGQLVGPGQGTDATTLVCLGHKPPCALPSPTLTPGLYLALYFIKLILLKPYRKEGSAVTSARRNSRSTAQEFLGFDALPAPGPQHWGSY